MHNSSSLFVLRCSLNGETQIRFAMTAVDSIKGVQLSIRSLACCGSVRTTRDKLGELLCIAEEVECGNNDRCLQIKTELLNVEF